MEEFNLNNSCEPRWETAADIQLEALSKAFDNLSKRNYNKEQELYDLVYSNTDLNSLVDGIVEDVEFAKAELHNLLTGLEQNHKKAFNSIVGGNEIMESLDGIIKKAKVNR